MPTNLLAASGTSSVVISGFFTVIAAVLSAVIAGLIGRRQPPGAPQPQPQPSGGPPVSNWQPPPGGQWQQGGPQPPARWQQAGGWQQPGGWQQQGGPQQPGAWAPPASARRKVSASVWWAIASLIAWFIPVVGYIVIGTGLGLAFRDRKPGSARTATTIAMVILFIALALTLANSIIGAYRGYHGTLFTQ